MAAASLIQIGVPSVVGNLAGGLAAWQAEGLGVEGQISAPFLK
jgi:rhodanese-related sulfurtransferase